jgi:hypothetical protein
VDATSAAPRVFSLDAERLAEGRRRVQQRDARVEPALRQLLEDADRALKAGPFSVVNKTLTPPSGDKHDYISFGPYWWPDPDKPDGLPYIRRDGQVNPETRTTASDRVALGAMINAVETLSLAFYFTGEERYAAHAIKLIRTWFLDEATRMNPHLRFGQAIPGRTEGRGIGIIDTRQLPAIVDAVGLLDDSPGWTDGDRQGMVKWMGSYLEWLLTSPHGIDEGATQNNHATYYDVQVVALALFVDRPEVARRVITAVPARRITPQIEPDGRQPHELARTRSFDYSVMNLAGMFELATLARHVGVQVWQSDNVAAARLRAALDYLLEHTDPSDRWPHQQINALDRSKLRPLCWRASILAPDPGLDAVVARLAGQGAAGRDELLWPRR